MRCSARTARASRPSSGSWPGSNARTPVRSVCSADRSSAGLAGSTDHSCAFIHQDLALFESMSVAANIALGSGFRRRLGLIDDGATLDAARMLLERLGMGIDPSILVGELPLADQTAVAIARALSHGVRLIVLDEPTAYLEARQVRAVLKLLANLRAEGRCVPTDYASR